MKFNKKIISIIATLMISGGVQANHNKNKTNKEHEKTKQELSIKISTEELHDFIQNMDHEDIVLLDAMITEKKLSLISEDNYMNERKEYNKNRYERKKHYKNQEKGKSMDDKMKYKMKRQRNR